MNGLETIQHLYQPLQPSVRSEQYISYKEISPAPGLRPFIYCYWQLQSTKRLSQPFLYKVVADGCIDIFFDLNHPSNSWVMGFCRNYVAFDIGLEFNYMGIRFLPTMFPHLFKISAHSLLNSDKPVIDVHPPTADFITTHIEKNTSLGKAAELFNDYFLALIASQKFDVDERLYNAIKIIYAKRGQVNISKDLNTGISPRQLRRIFQYYIGDTAKAFSKVVQFQNVLSSIRSWDHLQNDRIYLDNGYYDQAHFIKDFKQFYGVTPSVAFV